MKHLTNSLQFKDIVLYIDRKNNQLTENFLKTIMRFVKSQSHLQTDSLTQAQKVTFLVY